jgi:hypothetical protein
VQGEIEQRVHFLAALCRQDSRFPQILLISHIGGIQGEFVNTVMVEMDPDKAGKIHEMA